MTRDELIEALSQAIQNVPMVHTGAINVQGAIVADKRPPSVRIADAVLKAIEAQGLAIVPVEATKEMMRAMFLAGPFPEKPFEPAYRAMIEAGKL